MTGTVASSSETRSGNPALAGFVDDVLHDPALASSVSSSASVRVGGVAVKTLVLLGVVVAGGAWGWASATDEVPPELGSGYGDTTVTIPGGFWLASIAALLLGIMVSVAPRRAAGLGVVYSVLQGYCLGAISASFDAQTDGIVGAAVIATVCVFAVSLFLYATGIVRPTRKLAFGLIAAMGGLSLLYLFVFVLAIFDWGWLYSESFRTIGIVVTVLAVCLAALSLVLDFGAIDAAVAAGAPKQFEWYLAFGLMVTLVWLYVELLRLLALLTRNR